jgi:hypothetical protein
MLFMKKLVSLLASFACAGFAVVSNAAILTVTTTNNVSPASGEVSLAQAIARAAAGDEIRFNIPGAGPHYIATPPAGYPQITSHRLTIDGYSQPGSVANTNSILAPNNARIRVVLDSRGGGRTVLDFDGYGTSESAILGVVGATNFTVRGVGFLGRLTEGSDGDPAIYCVSFAAKAAGGHVNGCWMGVDLDGTNVFGANAAVTGFRFRENGEPFLSDNITVGVKAGATNAPAQFNVIAGMKIPIIVEGQNLRVSGNFIGVLPNGTNDVNNALAGLPNEGAIQVGRDGGGTLIGTDGDGRNDANERNIFGGVVPKNSQWPNGYSHVIEFYGGGPKTNVVVAGNYFGVGIDGRTRFTNGVPLLSGQTATTRIGSDFDGISDGLEGNLIFNNFPRSLFTTDTVVRDFLDGAGSDAIISLRGNSLVNNFAPPISPLRDNGNFITGYYGKALIDVNNGIIPVLSTNTTTARLVGRVPVADTNLFPVTLVDLYMADPEGLTNSVPEVPDAFVQGSVYLGTFVEGSAADLNPAPGEFDFDMARLNLAIGTKLTATANYSQDPVGTHNARTLTSPFSRVLTAGEAVVTEVRLSVLRSGNALTLSWKVSGYNLQSSTSVTGPWARETSTNNTFTTQISAGAKFYRLSR